VEPHPLWFRSSLFKGITTHTNATCGLPFVCRLEDATSRKLKPVLTQFGNVEEPVNAKGRMKRQQSATAGNYVEALC
jgi:hypothetical protein